MTWWVWLLIGVVLGAAGMAVFGLIWVYKNVRPWG